MMSQRLARIKHNAPCYCRTFSLMSRIMCSVVNNQLSSYLFVILSSTQITQFEPIFLPTVAGTTGSSKPITSFSLWIESEQEYSLIFCTMAYFKDAESTLFETKMPLLPKENSQWLKYYRGSEFLSKTWSRVELKRKLDSFCAR